MTYIGEIAALTTAMMWSFGSLLFAVVADRAGAFALNIFRITLAFGVLTLFVTLSGLGATFPWPGRHPGVPWLIVSGVIGLAIGDFGYFGALQRLGPRLATLLAAFAPPITAVLGWFLLHESLGPPALAGMGLVLAGVAWVVLERPATPAPPGHRVQGVLLGVMAAACQAVGLVLAKRGMGTTIDPLQATAVRMGSAMIAVWGIALVTRQLGSPGRVWRDRPARLAAFGATFLGPVFGVWLSLVAARHTHAGIAATLMATVPVLILPLVVIFRKERVSLRAALGAVVTVGGVALIFLRH